MSAERWISCIEYNRSQSATNDSLALDPYVYREDFPSRRPAGWCSYPYWQDTAYDEDFRIAEMVPGDPNLSIVQKVVTSAPVPCLMGAQKLIDLYLTPDLIVSFRCYLKTHIPSADIVLRFAAGGLGALEYRIIGVAANTWQAVTVSWADLCGQNPVMRDMNRVHVHACAIVADIPVTDPSMPMYFGLDDIHIEASRAVRFRFDTPAVTRLEEWRPALATVTYDEGGEMTVRGSWACDADSVTLRIASFLDGGSVDETTLDRDGDIWCSHPLALTRRGVFRGTLTAFHDGEIIGSDEFLVLVVRKSACDSHPRIWFDSDTIDGVRERLFSERFDTIAGRIAENAGRERGKLDPESIVYDLDQFPDEDWLPSWDGWGSRFYVSVEGLYWNALAYTFHDDRAAGEWVRNVMLAYAAYPDWTHPWQEKRGRFTEHRTGWWAHRLAIAYDLIHDMLSPDERQTIRRALIDKFVKPTHEMYVVDNDVTGNTSNWISHTAGASLMTLGAIWGDGEDTDGLAGYLLGAVLKLQSFLDAVTDPDGAWGEGLGYNTYSFHTLCWSLPALERVFGIDLSDCLQGTYREYIWAGPVTERRYFYFGDTEGELMPLTNWSWLLAKYRDPLLGWFYNALRHGEMVSNTQASMSRYMNMIHQNETFLDVLHETGDVPMEDPFGDNPVRCFRKAGTTVFKSGWQGDDFIFVMRTGPFFNHQHLDQGSFWLADRGEVFIEEGHGSSYYEDPLYRTRYIQPVGHSTILVDGNPQPQRTGDHLDTASGFNDYAYVAQFLDSEFASFVSGDIGRLYGPKVASLRRNVLYMKPRVTIMLDTVVPADKSITISALFQTQRLADIEPGAEVSTIRRNGVSLTLHHLSPVTTAVNAVETPHYVKTLREKAPLEREGLLEVSADIESPVVIATLLTTVRDGEESGVSYEKYESCVTGTASGCRFALTVKPGQVYEAEGVTTDALAIARRGDTVLAAMVTRIENGEGIVFSADMPVTVEIRDGNLSVFAETPAEITFRVAGKPHDVFADSIRAPWAYDANSKCVRISVPCGDSEITCSYLV